MLQLTDRNTLILCAAILASIWSSSTCQAQHFPRWFGYTDAPCRQPQYGNPDLFYNFYTHGNCNLEHRQLYPAPRQVPPNVGSVYYTYQPLLPHEYMYTHHRRYHRYYDDGRGLNRTFVLWTHAPLRSAAGDLYNLLRVAR
jgi:hypothetical protein